MQSGSNLVAQNSFSGSAVLNRDTEKLLSRLCVDVISAFRDEITPDYAQRLSAVDQVIVLYVIKGDGVLEWAGKEIGLGEGMVIIVPNNSQTTLRGYPKRDPANDVSALSGTLCDDAASDDAGNLIVVSSLVTASAGHGLGYFESLRHPLVEDANDPLLAPIFRGILNELENPGIGSKCVVEALMKQAFIVLLRKTLAGPDNATPLYLTVASPSLALVINTIQDSHAERLSIPGLARMVGMTPFALTQEFERVFGESLLEYIQGVRLHKASTLLTQTDLPIKYIAASVGFASRSHFSRAFRKRQGEDPTSFRKSHANSEMEFLQERDSDQLMLTASRG